MGAYAPHAALIASRIRRPNPITGGVVTADLGLVNGTPTVLVRLGDDTTRQATYTPPLAVQVGAWVFVTRTGADLTAPLLVAATNYQVPYVPYRYGGTTGSTLGVGSAPGAGVAPRTDWAAGMTDPANEDGALFPLTLGEVAR